jgi:hypothetical protein
VITLKDLEDLVLGKLELELEQEIKGLDLWNYLVQKGLFSEIRFFLGIDVMYYLKDSIIAEDEMTRSFLTRRQKV